MSINYLEYKILVGGNKLPENIELKVINFNNKNLDIEYDKKIKLEYDLFYEKLMKYKEYFGIYEKEKEIYINKYLSNSFKFQKVITDKIIYLYNKEDDMIISFAILTILPKDNNIIELTILCKNSKSKGKYISAYILDYIYDNYIFNTSIMLIIEPSKKQLISYYTTWKNPNIPIETLDNTFGYLVYYDEKYIEFDTLKNIFNDINILQKYLPKHSKDG
jgi:hypothetical protein